MHRHIDSVRPGGTAATSPSLRTLLFAAVVLATLTVAGTAGATSAVTAQRLAGVTRYETATAISKATWSPGRASAVLARGDTFPDSLVASHGAGNGNGGAPVLLTQRDHLPQTTLAEMKRLQIGTVRIMGGTDAVSAAVEAQLQAEGFATYRIAGATRYDTAAATVDVEDNGTFFVASGERFADALAAAPLSFGGPPILLTPRDSVHPALRRAIRDRSITRIIIMGGTAAISPAVEAELATICKPDLGCPVVTRIAGTDRLETATKIADFMAQQGRTDLTHINLARADTFPDALAGGPHAGLEGAPVIFASSPNELGVATHQWLSDNASTIASIDVFGDAEAVSDAVLAEARQAATTP